MPVILMGTGPLAFLYVTFFFIHKWQHEYVTKSQHA